MKTAFITGGLGLIGSHIAQQLVREKLVDKVILLDHFGRYTSSTSKGFKDYRNIRIVGIEEKVILERGDAKEFGVVYKLLKKYRPDYIFHLAALPLAKVENISTLEGLEGTVLSTSTLLESMAMLKDEISYRPLRFVYASSSMVYGDFDGDFVTEESCTRPKGIYGTMKLAGEIITKGLAKTYNIDFVIVRPSAVYGPTDMNRRVSQIFIEEAAQGLPLSIQGANEALDFTYVKDIANGFVLAAITPNVSGETFNITYGKAHTLLEYVECLKTHFPKLKYNILGRDIERPKRGTLKIDKAKKMLNYLPQYDLSKGIDEYYKFLLDFNPELFKKPD